MYFTKFPHPANFTFLHAGKDPARLASGDTDLDFELEEYEGEIYHLRVAGKKWPENLSLAPLELPGTKKGKRLKVSPGLGLQLSDDGGNPILAACANESFGVSGEASLFQFNVPRDARFYGMGQKNFGRVELSGLRTKFWTTDVWSDFAFQQWHESPTDPPYFATPYLVAKLNGVYVGFLLHNPHPTWMSTPGIDESRVFVEWQRTAPELVMGSEGGEPNLWIIYGPTLREVTTKLQTLVGTTPLPPLWALGYHQSRWGYGGHKDLLELDEKFEQNQIPCDALWLDLDYMRGFRIFETSQEMFPKGPQATADILAKHGRRIVPILDPGVKREPGYSVYDDGSRKNVFCQNAEGHQFVGMVWPGETVFPDFTLPGARTWWSSYVKGFANEGFGASWLDMNDPSTGPVDPSGMLFGKGKLPHAAHHNQYALGMQMASRDGFLQARPDERPFLLSRSGYTGSSRYSAIWTGDNMSNRFYLQLSIPTSIGMSLSGLPFNGPDLGGFGGDATDELMVDWIKAGFLFPFCRNHSTKDSKPQEPWAFTKPTLEVMRRYIRLRYKLLPYLYNLFIDQEELGEPVMRPLFYHFDDEGLDQIDDQFLIGPSILQAPLLEKKARRTVTLPGTENWYDAATGKWLDPGEHEVARTRLATPLYIRDGSILPMRAGTPKDTRTDLREVVFHIFASPDWKGRHQIAYRADDGLTFGYTRGERSEMTVSVESADGVLALKSRQTIKGYGPIDAKFVVHGKHAAVTLNGKATTLKRAPSRLAGASLESWLVQ